MTTKLQIQMTLHYIVQLQC